MALKLDFNNESFRFFFNKEKGSFYLNSTVIIFHYVPLKECIMEATVKDVCCSPVYKNREVACLY